MPVGQLRASSASECQPVDLQRGALIGAGVDQRHLYEDKASGAHDVRRYAAPHRLTRSRCESWEAEALHTQNGGLTD